MSAKNSELTDEISCAKSQSAAGAIVLDNLKSAAGNCQRPRIRATVMRQLKESCITSSTGAFSALKAEQEGH